MPPLPTENSINDSTQADDDETWSTFLFAGIGTVIGLVILGVFIWFLIKFLKKRKQKFIEEDEDSEEESKLSSIVIDPSNSSVNKSEAEDQSQFSADNNSQCEKEATKSADKLKETAKIQPSTTQQQQTPAAAAADLSSKQKVETPKKKAAAVEEKSKKVCETAKKTNAETPKKKTTKDVVPKLVKKKVASEEEQEASSKLDGESNVSKELSKETVAVKEDVKANVGGSGGCGEKMAKEETKNVQKPEKKVKE
uniref:Uncharacterized protein n=1 Tax=Panagrolaimus sp. ES5 TaxID=591445 RepID=A0AC34EZB3_9BILA